MSLLFGSVGGRFRTQLQPCSENELSFLVGTCVFLSHSSVLPPELHRRKKLWILIAGFPDEMWMLQQPKEEILAFFSEKKINFPSRPIKRLARQEVQPPSLVDMICTQTVAHWHPKIPIK